MARISIRPSRPSLRPSRAPAARKESGRFIVYDSLEVPGLAPRRVRVYLPPGWSQFVQRRSLYLFDGQNVFGDDGSYAGGWYAHAAVDGMRKVPAPALVAIDHGGEARIDELSAWSDRGKGGKIDLLLAWMTQTLMPRMRMEHGFSQGPPGVHVGGSSMGGLAALYAHFRHPEAFGGALCMSPSLWFANRAIFGFVAAQSIPWTTRIYLDCGAREGRGMMLPAVRAMAMDLRRRGYGDDRLMFRPDSKGTHSESSWRRRLPRALRFMAS